MTSFLFGVCFRPMGKTNIINENKYFNTIDIGGKELLLVIFNYLPVTTNTVSAPGFLVWTKNGVENAHHTIIDRA